MSRPGGWGSDFVPCVGCKPICRHLLKKLFQRGDRGDTVESKTRSINGKSIMIPQHSSNRNCRSTRSWYVDALNGIDQCARLTEIYGANSGRPCRIIFNHEIIGVPIAIAE